MTPSQVQQWEQFACMSKALIYAASVRKIPLTTDEYCARYEKHFPFPQKHYGGLILSRFYQIAREIGLGTDMDLCLNYGDVKKAFGAGRLVFVCSGIHLDPKREDIFNHTSVLVKMNEQVFGVSGVSFDLDAGDWVKKRCCAIVLY